MPSRDQILEYAHSITNKENLIRHLLAVEAAMRGLAERFGGNIEEWGLLGLIHDADWEKTESNPESHTLFTLEWLKGMGLDAGPFINAIKAHNRKLTKLFGEPDTEMSWSLDCVDELTGFIIAVALVRPEKKLATVDLSSIKKKWKQKEFARAVNRESIEACESKLNIPLDEFISITLRSLQGIADKVGL